jgi:hypothetical protein
MWLDHPDPATTLLEQIKHDPDAEVLGRLLNEWYLAFGTTPTTVRKAVEAAATNKEELMDALKEFPVEERNGTIMLLKKKANRIVNGLEFQKSQADGRTAWRIVESLVGASK